MNRRTGLMAVLIAILVTGCAAPPQAPVGLAADYFSATRPGRIGLAMYPLPAPDTSFPGADCLLCLAIASTANSSMTTAVKTWSNEDLGNLKGELASVLTQRGLQAVVIEEQINAKAYPDRKQAEPGFARKDFSALKATAGVDRLLVVNLSMLGVSRHYAAYIPTGVPQAVLTGEAFIVDLDSHRLDWYEKFDLARGADGNWDEPPKFPGLTNAYFQVIEEVKDSLKKALAK